MAQRRRQRTLGWRPRSLRARQLLAASLGLLAFLAAAGYALDRAFVDVASELQRDRLRKKLAPEGTLKRIETVRGRGYRFAVPRSNEG